MDAPLRSLVLHRAKKLMFRSPSRLLDQAARSESGASAVEFAFTLPILVLMITGIIQFGLILFLQNNMANVARDASRRLAVGEITKVEAEAEIQNRLVNWGSTFTVTITEPNPADPNDKDIDVVVTVPLADAAVLDPFGFFQSGTLQADVTMRDET